MAELLSKLQKLENLPEGLHWFCPQQDTEGQVALPSPTVSNGAHGNDADFRDAKARRELVLDCLLILAYDGEDVAQHQDFLKRRLDQELGKCDACIRGYYRGRRELIQKLNNDYEEQEVVAFFDILNNRDFARVKYGLRSGLDALARIAPEKRTVTMMDPAGMYALFEALSSETFIQDETLLRSYFDEPFAQVQRKRAFQVVDYVPAVTFFLFDRDMVRRQWAEKNWTKFRRGPTADEFEWAVRDPLSHNLRFGGTPGVPSEHIERLWHGVRIITSRLDKDVITHSLRALDVDVCRLALDHLTLNTAAFGSILQTVEILLRRAPEDFWDAMGAISPTTVIEQIFNNPRCEQTLKGSGTESDTGPSSLVDGILSWVEPFMHSLKVPQRAAACRTLVFQLVDRLQSDQYPEPIRLKCYNRGLVVLSFTLQSFTHNGFVVGSAGRVVLADTLEVVGNHIKGILHVLKLPTDSESKQHLFRACEDIVRDSLALECKSLRADHDSLKRGSVLPHGVSSYSPLIWDAIVCELDSGNMALAKATLLGIKDLVGLEKFSLKGISQQVNERSQFNITYSNLTQAVTEILERLGDFSSEDIDKLFTRYETADVLIASLFSADTNAYQAAINLIKNVSAESGRKEAMGHLLRSFFATTLRGLSWSVRRISNNRTFASSPRMLKTCTDILDILTNTQDGILRTKDLSIPVETGLVEQWWQNQWRALTVIFEMTEEWNNRGNDKETLMEFCRDTMQFAERLFEQYSVFSAAIASAVKIKHEDGLTDSRIEEAKRGLLAYPTTTMSTMVKWLRLRDVYLASTSVKLVTTILMRLGEMRLAIGPEAHKFIEGVIATKNAIRTILTPQEKAELGRALQQNEPQRPDPASSTVEQPRDHKGGHFNDSQKELSVRAKPSKPIRVDMAKRNGTLDMDSWRAKSQKESQKPPEVIEIIDDEDAFADPDLDDEDFMSLTPAANMFKSHVLSKPVHTSAPQSIPPRATGGSRLSSARQPPTTLRTEAERNSFREKREREKEAKRQRDAQELARLKKRTAPTGGVSEHTAGEGSGIHGLGVKGKDHAPKGSGMMISSDSESDNDGDLDRELFGTTSKTMKSSDAVKAYQESKSQVLRQVQRAGPVKKSRQIRSAKDMRARLAPDLSLLHTTILGWDFFHEGEFPPNSGRDDYSLVSDLFDNPTEYQSTFEPLLILEAWQGLLKAKEEGNFRTFDIKVANRITVDSFMEVSTAMPMSDAKELGIGEADIILISKSPNPVGDLKQPHCLARVWSVARKKNSLEVTYRINPRNTLLPYLSPKASLYGAKITSITPLEREYGALVGLKYYDLCDEIIRAKPSPILGYAEKQVEPIMRNYDLNLAQSKALRSAMDNDAFTLIQGPPGSGKTKTIVAIVGAILTEAFVDRGIALPLPQAYSKTERQAQHSGMPKKLLLCAPSNAAVDELVMRLKKGVKTLRGESHTPSIVRLGRSDAINCAVLDVTLEELVNARLNLLPNKKTDQGDDIHKLMMEHKQTSTELITLRERLDNCRSKGEPVTREMQRDWEVLKVKKNSLSAKIDAARDNGNTAARDAEINRRRVQQEILDSAHVICATLSGSGHEMFQKLNIEFETVIIDEAAQSIELSALIPLKYGCSKCIMVGDPKQLPPTVLSREAARFQYEQSLFVRMQNNHPNDVHLLDTQYRMHPDICRFPSKTFYDGRLLDGPNMAQLRKQPWHDSKLLGPYRFFDVKGSHQSAPKGHSLINYAEIDVALKLYDRLVSDYEGFDFNQKVGIITPYKSQIRELRASFVRRYGESILRAIDFNTTDAFQGRESDIIIFSCVRASSTKGIGFLADIRRMNVGLTRAKSSLWVLGNSQSLLGGEYWAKLVQDARSRGCYTSGDLLALLSQPLVHSAAGSAVPGGREDVVMVDAPASHAVAGTKRARETTAADGADKPGSKRPTPSRGPPLAAPAAVVCQPTSVGVGPGNHKPSVTEEKAPDAPAAAGTSGGPAKPPGGSVRPPAPMVMKRREVDIFIRPKPRKPRV